MEDCFIPDVSMGCMMYVQCGTNANAAVGLHFDSVAGIPLGL